MQFCPWTRAIFRGSIRYMKQIVQSKLSFAPWADPRTRGLPGIVPVSLEDWLEVDSAFAAQMALRARLIAETPQEVLALHDSARPAAEEMYRMILGRLPSLGYAVELDKVTRPDGVVVVLNPDKPLETLGNLVQCDLCLMQPDPTGQSEESLLTGAVLCFPSGWRLPQKFMMPMVRIHLPIEKYTPELAKRVQRLLDGVQVGRGLMRGTASRSDAPLADPRSEGEYVHGTRGSRFIRVERQCLIRLPETRAVVFSIHTQIVEPSALTPHQAQTLEEFPIRLAD